MGFLDAKHNNFACLPPQITAYNPPQQTFLLLQIKHTPSILAILNAQFQETSQQPSPFSMDTLLRQMRAKPPKTGLDNREETGKSKEGRLQPQKTLSGQEKKTSQSWIRRQFSTQMGQRDSESNHEVEYTTAVAAAVCAIRSQEESELTDQKKTTATSETLLTKQKTKKINITDQEEGKVSRRFSDIIKNQEGEKKKTVAPHGKSPEKAVEPNPSIKRASTFPDKSSDGVGGKNPENPAPKLNSNVTVKPSTGPTDAEAWKRAEMAKINNRYENLNATILSWEKEKKDKARRRHNRTESELSRQREESLLKFNREVEYISQIASGAKAKAANKRRNEELRVKEKSNLIRRTGEVPQTCFCF